MKKRGGKVETANQSMKKKVSFKNNPVVSKKYTSDVYKLGNKINSLSKKLFK